MTRSISVSLVRSPLTAPILDGTVPVEDVRVAPNAAPSVDENSRAMLDGAYDVAEMSLATFLRAREAEAPLIGLPVFPGRRFVQPGIAVRRQSGIAGPRELAGRLIGLPQYWLTSSVWHRGVLADDYGVAPESVAWVTVVSERGGAPFPANVRVATHAGEKIPDLLAAGEIDAALVPRPVTARVYGEAASCIFADPAAAQRDYLARTGIFPIMHFIVLRRSLAEEAPGFAASLFRAFDDAKRLALGDPSRRTGLESPVHGMEVDDALDLFGGDAWPYGLEPNRPALATFVRYALAQGLLSGPVPLERLFVPMAQ